MADGREEQSEQDGAATVNDAGSPSATVVSDDHFEKTLAVVREHIDNDWYISVNGDVAAAGLDAAYHYCRYGWQEFRNPSESFSTRYYIEQNSDVAEAGINPYWHYIVYGRNEGRHPLAVQQSACVGDVDESAIEDRQFVDEVATIRPFVDAAFYRNHYVIDPQIEPAEHYARYGWRERHNPSADFNTSYYLDANPDVHAVRLNPLWHYIVAGKAEGRAPIHPAGDRFEKLKALRTLAATSKMWHRTEPYPEILKHDDLVEALSQALPNNETTLLISVSHDDFQHVSGGVQLCVSNEMSLSKKRGFSYLHIRPWQPLPLLADRQSDPLVVLKLYDTDIGTATMSTVSDAIRSLSNRQRKCHVIVHQMLGNSPEAIATLIRATGTIRATVWLHDFFTLCPSFVLQRNDIAFCAGPPVDSNSCAICKYGVERKSHVDRMRIFLLLLMSN